MAKRFRNCIFTSFAADAPEYDEEYMKFMTFQKERCPDTKRLHWQGYLELRKQMRLGSIKKVLGEDSIHVENRFGTADEAIKYCNKLETRIDGPWTFGERSQPGKRNDLLEIKELMDGGTDERKISDLFFPKWCIHRKAFREYKSLHLPDRNWKTEVIVLWGDNNTGKSRQAHEHAGPKKWVKPNGAWFDTYEGQEHVIWDDFKDDEVTRGTFLQLCDRYPMIVPIKGGFVKWCAKKLWITSNYDPSTWYSAINDGFEDKAVRRRLDSVTHFSNTIMNASRASPTFSPIVHTPPHVAPIEMEENWE